MKQVFGSGESGSEQDEEQESRSEIRKSKQRGVGMGSAHVSMVDRLERNGQAG